MTIPNGFQLDPGSGLYYQETHGYDPETGVPVRLITWYNPADGMYHQTAYPVQQPDATMPEEVGAVAESEPDAEASQSFSADRIKPLTQTEEEVPIPAPPEPPVDFSDLAPAPLQAAQQPFPGKSASAAKNKKTRLVLAVLLVCIVCIGSVFAAFHMEWLTPETLRLAASPELSSSSFPEASLPEPVEEEAAPSVPSQESATPEPETTEPEQPEISAEPVWNGPEMYIYDDPTGQLVLELINMGEFILIGEMEGSTYSVEGVYSINGDKLQLVVDRNQTPYDWEGEAIFVRRQWQSMVLESPEEIGILLSGASLNYIGDEQEETAELEEEAVVREKDAAIEAIKRAADPWYADSIFPYEGSYICKDTQIPKEYRPALQLDKDMTFSIKLNMGSGIASGSGTVVWDVQPEIIYLNFEEIDGQKPVSSLETAVVEVMEDGTSLRFLTDGFGLMGYDSDEGIFIPN